MPNRSNLFTAVNLWTCHIAVHPLTGLLTRTRGIFQPSYNAFSNLPSLLGSKSVRGSSAYCILPWFIHGYSPSVEVKKKKKKHAVDATLHSQEGRLAVLQTLQTPANAQPYHHRRLRLVSHGSCPPELLQIWTERWWWANRGGREMATEVAADLQKKQYDQCNLQWLKDTSL